MTVRFQLLLAKVLASHRVSYIGSLTLRFASFKLFLFTLMIFGGRYKCKEQRVQTKPHPVNIRVCNQTTTCSNSRPPPQIHFSFRETCRYFY
jgi:hypothetical protein